MRMRLNRICVLPVLILVASCSHTITKPEWRFEKSAVRMHIRADNKLNLYNNKAHTLYVCLYQLEDPNAFDQLAEDSNGIRKLLECSLFDDSVAAASSKVIHAGEDIALTMDRAERAQYIAFVTGYSSELNEERAVRRHKFQVKKKRESLLRRIYRYEPCEMDLDVALGANQIEYSRILSRGKEMCYDECQ